MKVEERGRVMVNEPPARGIETEENLCASVSSVSSVSSVATCPL